MDDKKLPMPLVLWLCGGEMEGKMYITFKNGVPFCTKPYYPNRLSDDLSFYATVSERDLFWQVVRSMEAQSWAKEIGLVVYGITDNLGKSFHISSNRKYRSHDGDLYYDGFISQSEAATPFEALQNLVTEIYRSGVCRG